MGFCSWIGNGRTGITDSVIIFAAVASDSLLHCRVIEFLAIYLDLSAGGRCTLRYNKLRVLGVHHTTCNVGA